MNYSAGLVKRHQEIVTRHATNMRELVRILEKRAHDRALGREQDPELQSRCKELRKRALAVQADYLRLRADMLDEQNAKETGSSDFFGGLSIPDYMPLEDL